MGIKPSSIQDLGSMNPAPWVTKMGSSRINITAPGTYTVIPSPPPGKVRLVVDGTQGGFTQPPSNPASYLGCRLWSSNGSVMGPDNPGLTFDLSFIAQGRTISPGFVATQSLTGSNYGFLYLAPGETVQAVISSFAGGTTKVVGIATWMDFDATDVTFIRASFPAVNVPVVLIPPVPVGKIAAAYFPGVPNGPGNAVNFGIGATFINPDTNNHFWDVSFIDPAGGTLTLASAASLSPTQVVQSALLNYGGAHYSMVLVEGQSLTAKLNVGDTVPGTPPLIHAMYKLYDSV